MSARITPLPASAWLFLIRVLLALTRPLRAAWWRYEIRSAKAWHRDLLRNGAHLEAARCSAEIEAARVRLAMVEAGQ